MFGQSNWGWVVQLMHCFVQKNHLGCFWIFEPNNEHASIGLKPGAPTNFPMIQYDSIMFHWFLRARGSWIWSTATVTLFTCPCWWTLRTSGVGRTSFRVISSTSFTAARQWSFQMGVGQHDWPTNSHTLACSVPTQISNIAAKWVWSKVIDPNNGWSNTV